MNQHVTSIFRWDIYVNCKSSLYNHSELVGSLSNEEPFSPHFPGAMYTHLSSSRYAHNFDSLFSTWFFGSLASRYNIWEEIQICIVPVGGSVHTEIVVVNYICLQGALIISRCCFLLSLQLVWVYLCIHNHCSLSLLPQGYITP